MNAKRKGECEWTKYDFPSKGGTSKMVALDLVDKQGQATLSERKREREVFFCVYLFFLVSFLKQQKRQTGNGFRSGFSKEMVLFVGEREARVGACPFNLVRCFFVSEGLRCHSV